MKTTTQSTADFYSTINSLARFLLREKESGYVFAVAEDERILPEIFQTLRSKAAGKGKKLLFIRLLPESEQSILQQLLNALETQPGVEAVSVSGLDELLEKKTGTGQLTRNGKNRLLELNFARERLNELSRPIVFWVSPGNQTLLANQAADLFGQRRLSTFYFSRQPDVFDDNPFFQDRFTDGFHDPAEYERLKLRSNLLEKQLEEAENKNYPPGKIAREIVLPLAEMYSDLDLHQRASELLDRYNPKVDWEKADNLVRLGKIFHGARRYEEAIQFYQSAEKKLSKNPNLELSRIYSDLGDIFFEVGKLAVATAYYKKGLSISKLLHNKNPEFEAYRQNLAVSFEKLGEIYQAQGKFKEALDSFHKETGFFEALFQANPQSEKLGNGLAVSYEKLGDIFKAQGKLNEALNYYRKETALFGELFQANPHSENLKNGLAVSYSKLGEIYKTQGSIKKALDYFGKAINLFEELFQANPYSEKLKNGLAISYSKLSDIYKQKKKFKKALDYSKKDLQLMEELYRTNPNSENVKNGLAISYSKVGEIFQAQQKFDNALDYFKRDLELTKELFQTNPNSEIIKNGLAISYSKLGEIYQTQGKLNEALVYFEKRFQLYEELFQNNPYSENLKRGLAISYEKLGDIYNSQGKFKKALECFQKGLQLNIELFKANPDNIKLENGLAFSYYKMAEIYRAIPNSDANPTAYYKNAIGIWERILEKSDWPQLKDYIQHTKERLAEIEQV